METADFKKIIKEISLKTNFVQIKNGFFKESSDSIVAIIPVKSNYSRKFYLRVKADLKPIPDNFDKAAWTKHDVAMIMMSIDSLELDIFDLENNISDSDRKMKLEGFYEKTVLPLTEKLLNKSKIIEMYEKDGMFLLPYTKEKLGIT